MSEHVYDPCPGWGQPPVFTGVYEVRTWDGRVVCEVPTDPVRPNKCELRHGRVSPDTLGRS